MSSGLPTKKQITFQSYFCKTMPPRARTVFAPTGTGRPPHPDPTNIPRPRRELKTTKMRKQPIGKIVFVDNNADEKIFLEESLSRLVWDIDIEFIPNASNALYYLKNTKDRIFVIISAMNMSDMDGLQFKQMIDSDPGLVKKAIPFIFSSSSASREQVSKAYDYRIQGYFEKPDNLYEMAEMLNAIIQYWVIARHPNN
jgi:CheY-like chemotaxis protein